MVAMLKTPTIDHDRLMHAVDESLGSWQTYAPYLEFFRNRLRDTTPVPVEDVPADLITMNSRFRVKNNAGEVLTYTLVYPDQACEAEGKVSVLSPMGMALYGARVGDRVAWAVEDRTYSAVVEELLYQPEAAGDLQ